MPMGMPEGHRHIDEFKAEYEAESKRTGCLARRRLEPLAVYAERFEQGRVGIAEYSYQSAWVLLKLDLAGLRHFAKMVREHLKG